METEWLHATTGQPVVRRKAGEGARQKQVRSFRVHRWECSECGQSRIYGSGDDEPEIFHAVLCCQKCGQVTLHRFAGYRYHIWRPFAGAEVKKNKTGGMA